MKTDKKTEITVQARIHAPLEVVWECWTEPEHIVNWNQASADWHTTHAVNDLQPGGLFLSRMEAKDGSMGFDFSGVHENVTLHEKIDSVLGDDRRMSVRFSAVGSATDVVETFEAEETQDIKLQ